MFKYLLLRNYIYDQSLTVHECSLDGPLQTLGFLFRYEIQNGGYDRTYFSHWTLWEKCFKTLLLWNHLNNWNQTAQEWSLECPLQSLCFYADRKSKMAATAGHRLTSMPSSQKLQIWSKLNCTWMFFGWSSTNSNCFVPIWNSKWRLRQDLV